MGRLAAILYRTVADGESNRSMLCSVAAS